MMMEQLYKVVHAGTVVSYKSPESGMPFPCHILSLSHVNKYFVINSTSHYVYDKFCAAMAARLNASWGV